MSPGAAILVGSGIIGLSVLATPVVNHYLSDRYELATTIDNETALGWRLDKRTGAVTVCELARREPPAGDDPFAALEWQQLRPVDKIRVQCGYK
jgi:hypothetical protein